MTCSCCVVFGFVFLERLQVRLFPRRSFRDDASDPSRQPDDREMTEGPDDPRFEEVVDEGKQHACVVF